MLFWDYYLSCSIHSIKTSFLCFFQNLYNRHLYSLTYAYNPPQVQETEGDQAMVEFSADKSDTESDDSGDDQGDKTGVQTLVDEHQAQLWEELAKKKAARNIAVPTEDKRVSGG